MSIVDYLISIKDQTDRICISLKTSEMLIEITNHYCPKLCSMDREDDKILMINTKGIHLSIPESEIDDEATYELTKTAIEFQEDDYKKMDI